MTEKEFKKAKLKNNDYIWFKPKSDAWKANGWLCAKIDFLRESNEVVIKIVGENLPRMMNIEMYDIYPYKSFLKLYSKDNNILIQK